MIRNLLMASLMLSLTSSSAWAIVWNDIAVGTDTDIGNGTVFTLLHTDLSIISSRDQEGSDVVAVGFQTNGTPQPPNTPPGTWPGTNPLEAVVSLTANGVATVANTNRLDTNFLPPVNVGPGGTTLTVFGDDTVFFGFDDGMDNQVRDSGLIAPIGAGTVNFGTEIIDSVWQKLPGGDLITVYDNGGTGVLQKDPSLAIGTGSSVNLSTLPVDVDVLRQDPTIVVATDDNLVALHDGSTLAQTTVSPSFATGTQSIVGIASLADYSVAVALYDPNAGTSGQSQIVILNPDLTVGSTSAAFDYEITAFDNQNIVDTLILGTGDGEVKMLDGTTFAELHSIDLGNGRITTLVVNAPEPSTFVMVGLGLAGLVGFARFRRK